MAESKRPSDGRFGGTGGLAPNFSRITCFDVIRKIDTRLITPEIRQLEDLIRSLIDREVGKTPAWEGIRVIHESRV